MFLFSFIEKAACDRYLGSFYPLFFLFFAAVKSKAYVKEGRFEGGGASGSAVVTKNVSGREGFE